MTDTPTPKRGGRTPPTRTKGLALGSAGDGWGGPAKGEGSAAEVRPKPENMVPIQTLDEDQREDVKALKAYRDMTKAEVAIEMRQKLLTLAREAERPETQLSAAIALDNRVSGLPVATVAATSTDDIRAWMLTLPDAAET